MSEEPTVLDFVKSLLRGKPIAIPEALPKADLDNQTEESADEHSQMPVSSMTIVQPVSAVPSLSEFFTGLVDLAVQDSMVASAHPGYFGAVLAGAAPGPRLDCGCLLVRPCSRLADLCPLQGGLADCGDTSGWSGQRRFPRALLVRGAAVPAVLIAFLALGGNGFSGLNVLLWLFSLICTRVCLLAGAAARG